MGNKCIKCSAELTENNWARHCKDNWVNKCNACIRIEKKLYISEWRKKNPELNRERSERYRKHLRENDPIKNRAIHCYGDCRKRAIRMGMDFDLTPNIVKALFTETKKCPYFGWELTYSGKLNSLASLDRIDSARGYTKDNVRIISYLANLMKSRATEEELMQFAIGVISQHGTPFKVVSENKTRDEVQGASTAQ